MVSQHSHAWLSVEVSVYLFCLKIKKRRSGRVFDVVFSVAFSNLFSIDVTVLNHLMVVRSPALDLIALALNGKAAGFDEVIKMIDTMMYNLEKEQASDDNKKEYCEAELDKTEDKKKELELALKDAETAIDKMKGERFRGLGPRDLCFWCSLWQWIMQLACLQKRRSALWQLAYSPSAIGQVRQTAQRAYARGCLDTWLAAHI